MKFPENLLTPSNLSTPHTHITPHDDILKNIIMGGGNNEMKKKCGKMGWAAMFTPLEALLLTG